MDLPSSVEEAGALLGATLPRLQQKTEMEPTPPGLPSCFATAKDLPHVELFVRLHTLREKIQPPLEAAPSLVAVLMKVLITSVAMASNRSQTPPPLVSIPILHVWSDCVVLCHKHGGKSVDPTAFGHHMHSLASLHPKSAKAIIRVAAMSVLEGLWREVPHFSVDVFGLSLKLLRSAGHGEPSLRAQAVRTATAAVRALILSWEASSSQALPVFVRRVPLPEAWKIVRQAATDKIPSVRAEAVLLARALVPTLTNREEAYQWVVTQLDDSRVGPLWAPVAADLWYAAWSDEQESRSPVWKKPSIKVILQTLTEQYVKAGGELAASRMGGSFSTGGRAVRVGWTLVIVHVLKWWTKHEAEETLVIKQVMELLGEDMDRSLKPPQSGSEGSTLFGGRSWSRADAALVRMSVNRVLREGLSEQLSETRQLSLLKDLIAMLPVEDKPSTRNANQLQVALIEISHLVATLGEACASCLDELDSALDSSLCHSDPGVRHEASIACCSVAASFPERGRSRLTKGISELQVQHTQLVTVTSLKAANQKGSESPAGGGLRMFRRQGLKEEDKSTPSQSAIHGLSLVVSSLLRDLPRVPGGLDAATIASVLPVVEVLVATQFQDNLCKANPAAVCTCVRGGFTLISGLLSAGPAAVEEHMPLIFAAWKKSVDSARKETKGKHLEARHDLFCMDAALSSVVVFLKYCSELLLTVPEALTHVTVLLEDSLPLVLPDGRFGCLQMTLPVVARLETARASALEAFAWLPSGTFPMVADTVFSFAAGIIQSSVEEEVTCSILNELVSKEDALLDARTFSTAQSFGQVGGHFDTEETMALLLGEASHHGERESVLHLLHGDPSATLDTKRMHFRGSVLLASAVGDEQRKPPTPLHEVGTWRRPFDPSSSSKVRLVDAAIQAFSATFGLKSGKEQQSVMDMLESLVPPFLTQLARTIGVNATLVEQDRRSKAKEDSAAVANITSVLLSCLQALPLHEATHNVPIGLGPPWMNKAKDLLLTLLPSASNTVRRAAAEGLALLATLGVTEDAHFLQSTVLHSLDEVMQGNKPDGKPRIGFEPVSASRAGSLLTLACIQRTSYKVSARQVARARGRVKKRVEATNDMNKENDLPLIQMMTRILPSASCRLAFEDYFSVRTCAMHSYATLLAYSGRLSEATEKTGINVDDVQLLRKAVELVDDNFAAAWTVASADSDRGQEAEKLSFEVSFLAVLLRLMSFIAHHRDVLGADYVEIALRFSRMACIIHELRGYHPTIAYETATLIELCTHGDVVEGGNVNPPAVLFSKALLETITRSTRSSPSDLLSGGAIASTRAAVFAFSKIVSSMDHVPFDTMDNVTWLMLCLDKASSSRHFHRASLLRSTASARGVEREFAVKDLLERETRDAIASVVVGVASTAANEPVDDRHLRLVLFSLSLMSKRPSGVDSDEDTPSLRTKDWLIVEANRRRVRDLTPFFESISVVRWQVKTMAAQIAAHSIHELLACADGVQDAHFDLMRANELVKRQSLESSRLVFHLQELVSVACMSSTAAMEQAELLCLQESASNLLSIVVSAFARSRDPDAPDSSILEQYAQQIFSAVKHGISGHGSERDGNPWLFLSGCNALIAIARTGLSNELAVLRRLTRPLLLDEIASLPFVSIGTISPLFLQNASDTERVFRCVKLWALGKVLLGDHSSKPTHLVDLSNDLLGDERREAVASHCAAVAVDGASLLWHDKLSLAGQVLTGKVGDAPSIKSGFVYTDPHFVESSLRLFLTTQWSTLASEAYPTLLLLSKDPEDSVRSASSVEWTNALTALMFRGLHDALKILGECPELGVDASENGVKTFELLHDCIQGINSLVKHGGGTLTQWQHDIHISLSALESALVLPTSSGKLNTPEQVVDQTCTLLYELSSSEVLDRWIDADLLSTLISPLQVLEKAPAGFQWPPGRTKLIACCLASLGTLVVKRDSDHSMALTRTLIPFLVSSVLPSERKHPDIIRDAGRVLLRVCVANDGLSLTEKEAVSEGILARGRWDDWTTVVTACEGRWCSRSLCTVSNLLANSTGGHAEVVTKVRELVECVTPPHSLILRVINAVGADVLDLLNRHGSSPGDNPPARVQLCSDALKIMMIGFEQVNSAQDDAKTAEYMALLLESFVSVIRYNGLPNHPSPQPGSDPSLGRICAQAVTHMARTTPVPFKSSLGSEAWSPQEKALLELAVRLEMTGYAAPKKKLSLKSFKR